MQRLSANQFKNLKKQKRENRFLLFLDNVKIIKDAISNGIKPQLILMEEGSAYKETFSIYPILFTSKKEIEALSDSKTPQGVVCVAEYIQNIVKKPTSNFLVLDGLQDPGNVGTLIRTATACGFESVFLLECAHVTNPKVVRSSVGTIFQNNIFEISRDEFIVKAKEWDLTLYKADMDGENLFSAKFEKVCGVVIGNEGQGVSDQISALCKKSLSLPMKKGVESLNASISGAIIMYQIAKGNF